MNQLPVQSDRLHEIDVLYAIGTLLAILGHSHPNDWSTFPGGWVTFLYYFHMPLFFLIAGFLLARSGRVEHIGYGAWLRQKALRLLTPYFVLSAAALIPKYALEHGGFQGLTLSYVAAAFFAPRQNVWGHFWFLPVLCLLYVFFGALRATDDRRTDMQNCVVWIAVAVASFVLHFVKVDAVWFGISDLCDFAVYFAAGYWLFHFSQRYTSGGAKVARILVAAGLAALSVWLSVRVGRNLFGAALISAMMLTVCWEAGQLLKPCRLPALDFISRYVFTFYIYSWPAQAVVERAGSHFRVPWYTVTPAMFAAGVLCPAILIWVYRKCSFLHCEFLNLILGMRR